ncbi:hypothetical protein C8R47DRAFT_1218511 [Mycena vitilis]|nr:hypothetical protein C8R47DRAFT_1218511 [Mycena vitilis]
MLGVEREQFSSARHLRVHRALPKPDHWTLPQLRPIVDASLVATVGSQQAVFLCYTRHSFAMESHARRSEHCLLPDLRRSVHASFSAVESRETLFLHSFAMEARTRSS